MTKATTTQLSWMSNPSHILEPACWLAVIATGATIFLLAALLLN